MAIKLKIKSLRDNTESDLSFEQSLITFGRSKACHVELASPDVSRRHFLIKYIDGDYVLLDEGSRFGTTLDDQKIRTLTIYPIKSKHLIEVPGFLIEVVCDGMKPRQEKTTVVARKVLDTTTNRSKKIGKDKLINNLQ